jgi:photosystem II stability/assembly factor-like uncharacterized protein
MIHKHAQLRLGLAGVLALGSILAAVSFPPRSAPTSVTRFEKRQGQEEKYEEHEESEATGGAINVEERYRKRLDSKGEFDPNTLIRAKKHIRTMPVAVWYDPRQHVGRRPQDAGITGWEWLGPGNVGGRIRAIVFLNPTTLLIGAASGGIWRSTNAGASWQPMNDFLASLSVSCLSVDPTNTNIVYAGTGEGSFAGHTPSNHFVPGAGIFKSTDGGLTWAQLTATTAWRAVNRLAHHPTQTGTLFAATDTGLFRITNGGTNTTPLLSGTVLDVKVDPANPSRMIAGGFNWVGTSQNGGTNWTTHTTGAGNQLPNTGQRSECAIGGNGTLWVSMNIGTGPANDMKFGSVYRSTDNGANWQRMNNNLGDYFTSGGRSQGNYDNVIWASPDDPNLVIVGGVDLWRTENGGQTWDKLSRWQDFPASSAHADQHVIVAPPDYGPNNRALYFGNDGGIQRRNDAYADGEHNGWVNLANGLGITQFHGGAAYAGGTLFLGGAQDNGDPTLEPGDPNNPGASANNWQYVALGDGGYCAIDSSNPDNRYTESQFLHIRYYNSSNGQYVDGINGLEDADKSDKTLFIAPFVLASLDTLVAGGVNIWRSTDRARNWHKIRNQFDETPVPMCSAIAVGNNPNNLWIGYHTGRVSRTQNNDVTQWVDITFPVTGSWVTDIAINPKNNNEVFVTVGGATNLKVFFTDNNGANWQNRNGNGVASLPNVQVNTITFHPDDPSLVYVGTDVGVFASDNKGITWSRTPLYPDFPWRNDGPANVEVTQLFWQGSYLVAATYGRGMYRTRPYWVIHVDKSYFGFIQDGSPIHPFKTMTAALANAVDGTLIIVHANDYNEGYKLTNKRVRIISAGGSSRVH